MPHPFLFFFLSIFCLSLSLTKETYETFHFTSLLYLSDYGSEFQGGRFVFVDGDHMNRTVEPRKGDWLKCICCFFSKRAQNFPNYRWLFFRSSFDVHVGRRKFALRGESHPGHPLCYYHRVHMRRPARHSRSTRPQLAPLGWLENQTNNRYNFPVT